MPIVPGYTHYTIIWSTTSSVSVIASCALIYVILGTEDKLASTRNRLLFGLSACDIIFSAAAALNTIPSPADTANELFTPSYGSQTTCDIQGFLIIAFSLMGPFYNCMLNLYYLCVIKLNYSTEYIAQKIEPFMHIVPMLYALSVAGIALSKKYINTNRGICFLNTSPDFCVTTPGLDCDRGDKNLVYVAVVAMGVPLSVCFVTIIVSWVLIYRTVREQETKMKRYRHSSIARRESMSRRNSTRSSFGPEEPDQERDPYQWLRRRVPHSRKIMHQSVGFVGAYLLSQTFFLVNEGIFFGTGNNHPPLCISARLFYPLQGLFNFIVFIFPKVTVQLRGNQQYTLWEGFKAAIQNKETLNRRRSSLALGGYDRPSSRRISSANNSNTTSRTPNQTSEDSSLQRMSSFTPSFSNDCHPSLPSNDQNNPPPGASPDCTLEKNPYVKISTSDNEETEEKEVNRVGANSDDDVGLSNLEKGDNGIKQEE